VWWIARRAPVVPDPMAVYIRTDVMTPALTNP